MRAFALSGLGSKGATTVTFARDRSGLCLVTVHIRGTVRDMATFPNPAAAILARTFYRTGFRPMWNA